MAAPLNPSEVFVLELCQKSCLRFWCYNNPRFVVGKELCDVLVVFDRHILIFSVKDSILKTESEIETEEQRDILYTRWNRKAVEKSVGQIYGAEKSLLTMSNILNSEGEVVGKLPSNDSRIIHRLAIAFGSRCEIAIVSKDYGQGFVHVMNEDSFSKILTELDTITDLVEYLSSKEELTQQSAVLSLGSEVNLLAYYLSNGRRFQHSTKLLIIADNAWETLQTDPLFQNRKRDDKSSYCFDDMINFISAAPSTDSDGNSLSQIQKDMALRVLAQETRFSRRALATALKEFLKLGFTKKIDARIVRSPTADAIYIWRFFRAGESADQKISELIHRSYLIPRLVGETATIVGIGFDMQEPEQGLGFTITYLPTNEMTSEGIESAETFAKKMGFFTAPIISTLQLDEYPQT